MGASTDFRQFIVSAISVSAVYDILGTPTPQNQIVYTTWPQQHIQLGTGTDEPTAGYLCYRIDDFVRKQDILEFKDLFIDIWSTRPSILEAVKDIFDEMFHHKLAGQNGLGASTFQITFSQLTRGVDLYEDETHLYRKQAMYEFRMVRAPFG